MITSLSWLKNHLSTKANLNQVAERLTDIGLEVESVKSSNIKQLKKQLSNTNNNILVEVSAAWCITCKTNKLLVLNSNKTQTLLKETNTTLMTLDWTNQNKDITDFLNSFGVASIPFYVLYKPNKKIDIIGSQISFKKLEDKLKHEKN